MSTENKQFSDLELVLYMTGYNTTAYEQFYERYSARVYALIRKIIPDERIAQSVLINIFATFLKRIDLYDTSKDNVFTWLMLLSRNISLDILKRIKQKQDLSNYDDDYELAHIIPQLSPSINPINSYSTAGIIKLYKNNLTEIQNLVLSVAYFEGLTEEEISKRLNLPLDNIKEKLQGILESLMELYCKHEQFSGIKKEMIDLIRLDVLGCLSEPEKNHLNLLKNNTAGFLWKEWGDYQNLIALIPTALTIEQPPRDNLQKVLHNVDSVLNGRHSDYTVNLYQDVKQPAPEKNIPSKFPKTVGGEFAIKFKEPQNNPIFAFKKDEPQNHFNEIVSPLAKSDKELKNVDVKTEIKAHSTIPEKKDLTKPQEINKNNVAARSLQPTSERLNVNTGHENTQIQMKEIKQQEFKENKTVQAKTISPTSDRINTNITSKPEQVEKRVVQDVSNKGGNLFKDSKLQPTSDRFNVEQKKNPEIIENKIPKPELPKEIKTPVPKPSPIENKNVSVKPPVNKVNEPLKKIEPVIADKIITPKTTEKPSTNIKAKESINIDEIISKIENEKLPEPLPKTELEGNDEVLRLKKKLKRNYYLSAAVIILFVVAGVYLYTKFNSVQSNPVNNTNNIVKSETTPIVNSNTATVVPTLENPPVEEKKTITTDTPAEIKSEKKDSSLVIAQPLSTKEENTIENANDSNITNNIIDPPIKTSENIDTKKIEAAPLTEIKKVTNEPEVFVAVEEQPQLIGGLQSIQNKITYPEMASKLGIEGKVFVQAIIGETGNVISTKIVQGIGAGCDEIAMNAVKDSKFIPGKQRGRPVKVQITIPIVFKKQ